ncbi:signal peptide peptidase SppA [Aestuariibacter sp. AA17]|uniref:Signal peptide peptidase SppA n=1 Tax=Fluctibacter corallii TaxID=2984329 RepID=A0ABT3A6F4_9ALTE|nr:signal peptide peptidase SppA [Aestuariibacter sp. AA17]MCV2884260.1 signal peptide peptidase SppA [Aestuariibacter sp. AA17]
MTTKNSWTKSFFLGLWTVLNVSRKAFFNIIFILIIVGIFAAMSGDDGKVMIPKDTALVLNVRGDIVIEKRNVDPFEAFMSEAFGQREENPEVLLRDLVFAIDQAKEDNRIKALVLDLHEMNNTGLDKLSQFSGAIERFKESGKPVYAIGDYFTQEQYYVASHADHVYMNPMGYMLLEGYGRYRMYFKSALEKLKASTYVFRVGTYKSAIEPYIRDDMSDAAKEANQEWLNALWMQYKTDVAAARGFDVNNFDDQVESFMAKFKAVDGSFAKYALEYGWIDAIKSREDIRDELIAIVGLDEKEVNFSGIDFDNYLDTVKGVPFPPIGNNNVGIVVAKGVILNGQQQPGDIGGDSTANLLRQARLDDSIKAVVMHVDSPGGSAFASEVIRQEIKNLRNAGKPVVAVMSTYAASGGYWISASTDEIWAAPSTITGSIGVFGMFMSWENSLSHIGIHTDGVGTTDFAGMGLTRELDPRIGNIIQYSVENTYDQFLTIVSEGRDIPKARVDEIAQGRVWIGSQAKELGLVDNLGYLDDAVKSAAQLANLETYDTKYVERELSPKEKFLRELFGQSAALVGKVSIAQSNSALVGLVKDVISRFDALAKLNDPKGTYAYCIMCEM